MSSMLRRSFCVVNFGINMGSKIAQQETKMRIVFTLKSASGFSSNKIKMGPLIRKHSNKLAIEIAMWLLSLNSVEIVSANIGLIIGEKKTPSH